MKGDSLWRMGAWKMGGKEDWKKRRWVTEKMEAEKMGERRDGRQGIWKARRIGGREDGRATEKMGEREDERQGSDGLTKWASGKIGGWAKGIHGS